MEFIQEYQRNCDSGHANNGEPYTSPENKGEVSSFIKERRNWEGLVWVKVYWKNESSGLWWLLIGWVVAVSHWLGCCWARRKLSLFLLRYRKWVFPAGICRVSPVEWYMCQSSSFWASWLLIEWGFPLLIFTKSGTNRFLTALKRNQHCQHLDLGLSGSRIVRK